MQNYSLVLQCATTHLIQKQATPVDYRAQHPLLHYAHPLINDRELPAGASSPRPCFLGLPGNWGKCKSNHAGRLLECLPALGVP